MPRAWALVVISLFAVGLRAQNPRGSLRGTVQDASGARVPSATIEVAAAGSNAVRRAASDERGEFRIDDFLPGSYRVTVRASGFANAEAEVSIVVATVRDVAVTLKPRVVGEHVDVRALASSIATQNIDLASAVHQSAVTARDLETIPLAARSFANIAYLAPGTEPVEPSDPTKARITAVSMGGSSGLNNEVSVDGGDNSDDYIGGFLQNFSPEAIEEFAVRTAQEDADTGGTTSGSIVLTTKRGTNDWHGGASFYERAAGLNARYPIDNPAQTCTSQGCVSNPKQPFSRQNYVATLGGPIQKDKLWVFGSFDIVHEDASIAYSPTSITQFNALAALAAQQLIPGVSSIAVPQNVSIPFRDYNGSLRFDWDQSQSSHWFVRLSGDKYTTNNAIVQQGSLPNTGLTTHNAYWNAVLGDQHSVGSNWLGSLVLGASYLHLTQGRNADLGFALAFPFTSTSQTISGFETFGDNQFHTPITLFPSVRTQEKYQLRYDVSHTSGHHAPKFGINFIHEPVLGGAFASTPENLTVFVEDPSFYTGLTQADPVAGAAQFTADLGCAPVTIKTPGGPVALQPTPNTSCSATPAGNGSFSQNVQRLALYAEDSWRATRHLTINYGLRYQTTFGLFEASGRNQFENPAYLTLQALQIPLVSGVPHDDRKQIAPRIGIAYSPGDSGRTVLRAGIGLFYNDLAQTGWATALQAVNAPTGPCTLTGSAGNYQLAGSGCILGGSASGGSIIGSNYKTPYALHITGGIQHAFNDHWMMSAEYTHEQGNHGYRAYSYTGGQNLLSPLFPSGAAEQQNLVPSITVFNSDDRSAYDALMVHLQASVTNRFSLVANYTLARAKTWGCVLGEIFDYVNGVCDPLNPFAPGDYGPSGEDVRHRFVLAGKLHLPGGIELTTLTQVEAARPFTITTADGRGRISVNGVSEGLDAVRGTPYIQVDLRVSRLFRLNERFRLNPFVEFFNLFNRNNAGANYVTNIALLPVPPGQAQLGNITSVCLNPTCSSVQPITSINQLRVPAGGLGDFFGPGTTVGIPFAAQVGVKLNF